MLSTLLPRRVPRLTHLEDKYIAERIETAAVIGAGVMGSAIAAHFAGAGIKTHLLDIVPPNLADEQ